MDTALRPLRKASNLRKSSEDNIALVSIDLDTCECKVF
jgi:hypothetical protein